MFSEVRVSQRRWWQNIRHLLWVQSLQKTFLLIVQQATQFLVHTVSRAYIIKIYNVYDSICEVVYMDIVAADR